MRIILLLILPVFFIVFLNEEGYSQESIFFKYWKNQHYKLDSNGKSPLSFLQTCIKEDTLIYLHFDRYQRRLYGDEYSFSIFNLKNKTRDQYHFNIPQKYVSYVRKNNLVLYDIAYGDKKLFLSFLSMIIQLDKKNNTNNYIVTDWHKFPENYFRNIEFLNEDKLLLSYLSESSNKPDAKIKIYNYKEKETIIEKVIPEIEGSILQKLGVSKWIVSNKDYTVVPSISEYKLRLFDNKNLDELHSIHLDSFKTNTSYLNTHNINSKADIHENRDMKDTIFMIKKMLFINDSMFLLARVNDTLSDKDLVALDFWKIKEDQLKLVANNIIVNSSCYNDRLKSEIMTRNNYPISSIIYSPPTEVYDNFILSFDYPLINMKDPEHFFNNTTYKDYIKEKEKINESPENKKRVFEVKFYKLFNY